MNPDYSQSLPATFASGLFVLLILFGPLLILNWTEFCDWIREVFR